MIPISASQKRKVPWPRVLALVHLQALSSWELTVSNSITEPISSHLDWYFYLSSTPWPPPWRDSASWEMPKRAKSPNPWPMNSQNWPRWSRLCCQITPPRDLLSSLWWRPSASLLIFMPNLPVLWQWKERIQWPGETSSSSSLIKIFTFSTEKATKKLSTSMICLNGKWKFREVRKWLQSWTWMVLK